MTVGAFLATMSDLLDALDPARQAAPPGRH
jgi:hypothetical protein